MGLRAIPAQRLLASHASTQCAVFSYSGMSLAKGETGIDPLVVLSPCMFLPAVIARAEALAKFQFGSTDMLGVKRISNDMAILGVEADVAGIDGSPQGILRALLLSYANEQVFNLYLSNADDTAARPVDLANIRSYYLGEGALALRGEQDDLLTSDPTVYDWTPR